MLMGRSLYAPVTVDAHARPETTQPVPDLRGTSYLL